MASCLGFSTNEAYHCGDRHARTDPQARRPGASRPPGDRSGLPLGQGPAGADRRYSGHRADRIRPPEPGTGACEPAGSDRVGGAGVRRPGTPENPEFAAGVQARTR